MYKKTPRGNLIRSFIKIHFSLIISMIILILMISTFIGAAHFEGGVISIEPSSRNLIIYAGDDSPSNNTISVRGPYTVDLAIENESDMIRVPYDAMATLGVGVNDTLIISGEEYTINQTRDGEPNMLRVPIEAKNRLNVEVGDVIQNSLLTQSFEGSNVTLIVPPSFMVFGLTLAFATTLLSGERTSKSLEDVPPGNKNLSGIFTIK